MARDIIWLGVWTIGFGFVMYFYLRKPSHNLFWVLVGITVFILTHLFDFMVELLAIQFSPPLYVLKEKIIFFLLGAALATTIIFLFFVKEQPRNPNDEEK